MVLLEEFKDKVRPDIRSNLDEQKVEELEKAGVMADDYALTHKEKIEKPCTTWLASRNTLDPNQAC